MMLPSIFGENLFDDLWNDFPWFDDSDMRKAEKKLYGHRAKRMMKTDIKEHDDRYEIILDLPGFKKDEVQIELNDGYMTISAEKGLEPKEEKKPGRYIRQERYAGACQRSFYVGDDLTEEDISAKFRHGVLKVTVPKKEAKPAVDAKKYIEIEG